jgi:hypothetical protein
LTGIGHLQLLPKPNVSVYVIIIRVKPDGIWIVFTVIKILICAITDKDLAPKKHTGLLHLASHWSAYRYHSTFCEGDQFSQIVCTT